MFSNTHKKAIIALIIANIIWGVASPIFKLALQNIPPFTLAFLRFFGAMIIIFPFAYKKLSIDKKDMKNLILLSLFGITINVIFFFYGLKYSPSINAPVIASSGPVFLYLYSIFYFGEKLEKRILSGTIVSLLGVLIIVVQPIIANGFDMQVLGNLLFILATIGAVGHAVYSKKIITRYAAQTVVFWSFFIGSLTFFPFYIRELITFRPFDTIDGRGVLGIIFGIFLSSLAAYYLFERGVKYLDGQEIGIFSYIDPIAAAILAILLLGEKITPVFLIGSILIFGGIFIAEGRINYHPLQKLRK